MCLVLVSGSFDICWLIVIPGTVRRRSLQKAYFFPPRTACKHWVFLLAVKVSDSKVPAILKKFVFKEARNSASEAASLKMFLATGCTYVTLFRSTQNWWEEEEKTAFDTASFTRSAKVILSK